MTHQTEQRSGGPAQAVLTINGGSSSIKFALFLAGSNAGRILSGKIERIGLSNPEFIATRPDGVKDRAAITAPDHAAGASVLTGWLDKYAGSYQVRAVGHRIVHGGPSYSDPRLITPDVLSELHRISPLDPEHLPAEIALVEAFARQYPNTPQVACFDTAFHRDLPRVARIMAVPRRLEALGVRRYGFHGLSYTFLMRELVRVAGPAAAAGRVVLAHLGNGASLAAVSNGKCIDTSMGLTPAAGIPMGTRTGDIDPGLVRFLADQEGMSADQFDEMVTHQSGLLGVSETSSDMRDLVKIENTDVRAAEAVSLFCYQTKKWIGSFAAALGGIDTLIFAGGIGENDCLIRSRICQGLEFLGIKLDAGRNAASAPVISMDSGPVVVRVIATDEERVIAEAAGGFV